MQHVALGGVLSMAGGSRRIAAVDVVFVSVLCDRV